MLLRKLCPIIDKVKDWLRVSELKNHADDAVHIFVFLTFKFKTEQGDLTVLPFGRFLMHWLHYNFLFYLLVYKTCSSSVCFVNIVKIRRGFKEAPGDKQMWSWAWIILETVSKFITCLLFHWQNLCKTLIAYDLKFSSEFATCPDILQKIKASGEKKKSLVSFTLNLQKWKPTAVSEPKRNKKHVAGGTMPVHRIAI